MSCDINVKTFIENARRVLLDFQKKEADREETKILLALNYLEAALQTIKGQSFLDKRETRKELPGWEHSDETKS